MLVSIGVTPPPTTMTRLRWRQGGVSKGRRHKKGHRCQQQHKSNNKERLTTTTLTTMMIYQQLQQLQDADGDNGNN